MEPYHYLSAAYKEYEGLDHLTRVYMMLRAAEPGQPIIQIPVFGRSTSLHLAAKGGHKQTVMLLLDRGAQLNMTDYTGRTPLHWAADRGHKDVVEVLLNTGADISAVTNGWYTPLHYAARKGHNDIVLLLLDRGAEINPVRWTPLHLAVMEGHEDVVRILLHKGADPNRFFMGEKTLSLALINHHMNIANILRENGGN